MEILDRLYINAYFKNTDCLDFEGSYYKLRLKGENLEGLDGNSNTVGEAPEEKRARRNNKPRTPRRKD